MEKKSIEYNNDVIVIDTIDLMKLWLKKAWIIMGMGVLCAIAAYAYCDACSKQIYQSVGKMLVINQREELTSDGQVTTNANLTDDYIEVIKSRTVVNQVIDNLGIVDSYEQLAGNITVTRIDETRILEVSVSNTDESKVQSIANELLRVAPKYMESFLEVYAVKIMDEASEPIEYASINVKKCSILAFGAGVALALFGLAVYYLLNNTIENAEQVKRRLHCETLGMVNTGVVEWESFETLRTNIKVSAANLQTLAITNCNDKQGIFELTYKVAASFAKNDKKVLLIDANMRNGQTDEKLGLSDVLFRKKDWTEVLVKTDMDGLSILNAGRNTDKPCELLDSDVLDNLLHQIKKEYDMVVFSTPTMEKYIDAAVVAKRCDATLMVVERNKTDYRKLQSAIKQLVFAKANLIGCVIHAKKV